jgi:hypothetical protein
MAAPAAMPMCVCHNLNTSCLPRILCDVRKSNHPTRPVSAGAVAGVRPPPRPRRGPFQAQPAARLHPHPHSTAPPRLVFVGHG